MIEVEASKDNPEWYSVNWKSQEINILDGLRNLVGQDGALLTDVTLACDGEYVQAHKLVLSLCSTFFKEMFQRHCTDKSNTIIILGHISARCLRYILKFMYQGRVDIPRCHVDSFLEAGSMLKVEGLMESVPAPRLLKPEVFQRENVSLDESISASAPAPPNPSSSYAYSPQRKRIRMDEIIVPASSADFPLLPNDAPGPSGLDENINSKSEVIIASTSQTVEEDETVQNMFSVSDEPAPPPESPQENPIMGEPPTNEIDNEDSASHVTVDSQNGEMNVVEASSLIPEVVLGEGSNDDGREVEIKTQSMEIEIDAENDAVPPGPNPKPSIIISNSFVMSAQGRDEEDKTDSEMDENELEEMPRGILDSNSIDTEVLSELDGEEILPGNLTGCEGEGSATTIDSSPEKDSSPVTKYPTAACPKCGKVVVKKHMARHMSSLNCIPELQINPGPSSTVSNAPTLPENVDVQDGDVPSVTFSRTNLKRSFNFLKLNEPKIAIPKGSASLPISLPGSSKSNVLKTKNGNRSRGRREFTIEKCEKCGKKMLAKSLTRHKKRSCNKRITKRKSISGKYSNAQCPKCGKVMQRKSITRHLREVCGVLPMQMQPKPGPAPRPKLDIQQCPGCGKRMLKRSLGRHLEKFCNPTGRQNQRNGNTIINLSDSSEDSGEEEVEVDVNHTSAPNVGAENPLRSDSDYDDDLDEEDEEEEDEEDDDEDEDRNSDPGTANQLSPEMYCKFEDCGFIPESVAEYQQHLILHPLEVAVPCPNCAKVFVEKLNMEDHLAGCLLSRPVTELIVKLDTSEEVSETGN